MATTKQKEAARRNLEKAREGLRQRALEKNLLSSDQFAIPAARKEPLTDAAHGRSAIARFDQVEGVRDAERDRVWDRITAAARVYDIEVSASDWREPSTEAAEEMLMSSGVKASDRSPEGLGQGHG
jgi:hypothetical protein